MRNLYILLSIFAFHENESGRILVVIPSPSLSHQVVFRSLTQELAKRGHDVTVVTTDPAFPKGLTPANLTEIDLHDISYKIWEENFLRRLNRHASILEVFQAKLHQLNVIFEKQIQSEEFQDILQKDSDYYDLLIVEGCFRHALVFSHVFKAPLIQMNSFGAWFGNYEVIGTPIHPLLYPKVSRQRIYNLSVFEKVTELYNDYWLIKIFKDYEKEDNEMLRRNFGSEVPDLSELANNVQMLFLNVHPIFEGNTPVPPSVVHIGGIHKVPEKELPKDLKTFMDSSKHGVIYMSFGTNADPTRLPPAKIQIFVRVFSKLQYDVLLKWNKDELPGRTDNIRIAKWFPQSDLLRHPKLKLFITQGGLQSTDEAIDSGVPLVGIPILGDQWYNTEKYVHLKIGVKLDIGSLTDDQFRNAIETVIEDTSYRENVVRLRTLMRDEPQTPLQRAVRWTEHVLRHGGAPHLRAPAANMSWTRYYEIELVFVVFIAFTVVLSSFTIIVYQLLLDRPQLRPRYR